MGGGEGFPKVGSSWGEDPVAVPHKRSHPWFVVRNPLVYPIAQGGGRYPGILGEGIDRVAATPSAPILRVATG